MILLYSKNIIELIIAVEFQSDRFFRLDIYYLINEGIYTLYFGPLYEVC
jgi:hypothetical protein